MATEKMLEAMWSVETSVGKPPYSARHSLRILLSRAVGLINPALTQGQQEDEADRMLGGALEAAEAAAWQPMKSAPKDRTPIHLCFKNPCRPDRPDLERWDGIQIVGRHPGLAHDGFDIGWNVAAPVGHGGFSDECFAGWRPLPEPPKAEREA